MNTKLIFLFSLCVFGSFQLLAQDPFFSQYNQGESILNPALIGNIEGDKKNKLSANYRNYWKSDYQIALLGYERKFSLNNDQIGIGTSFLYDKAGDQPSITNNSLIISAAYHKSIGTNQQIQAGISTTLGRRKLDATNLPWSFDVEELELPSIESLEEAKFSASFNTGLVWTITKVNGNRLQVGASVYHLNQPNRSFVANTFIPRHSIWNIHTSYLLKLGDNWEITPSILAMQQASNGIGMLVAGSNFGLKIGTNNAFVVGAHTRFNRDNPEGALFLGSYIGMLGYQHGALNLQFSVDVYRKDVYVQDLKYL